MKCGKHSCMKRMFVFLFVLIAICSIFFVRTYNHKLPDELDGDFYIYTNSTFDVSSCDVEIVKNGPGLILKGKKEDLEKLNIPSSVVGGYSVFLDENTYNAQDVMNQLDFVVKKSSKLSGDIETFYGYSSYGGRSVKVGGHRVNCQVAINANGIIVGFPLILGSY